MLLALMKVSLNMEGRRMTQEYGHMVSKNISRSLDRCFKSQMMQFYPSNINMDSLEFVVEFIGSSCVDNCRDKTFKSMENTIMDFINSGQICMVRYVAMREISFCEASAILIYCYKQDDYLIPDSDPHDVMSSENMYNDALHMYSGRFLPMIKLWCDLVQPVNTLFTAGVDENERIPNDKNIRIPNQTAAKSLEYSVLSKANMDKEIKVLESYKDENKFGPFNKYYKVLMTDRTMIPSYMAQLIPRLREKGKLSSSAYYVLDVMNLFAANSQDDSFIAKFEKLIKELKGATLVLFVDVPNYFLVTNGDNSEIEAEHYQLSKTNSGDSDNGIDNEYSERMLQYDLLDCDDSLDFPGKVDNVRKVVNIITNATKEEAKFADMENINRIVSNIVRSMNVVIAYTDTIAYTKDYIFKGLKKYAKLMSIKQVELSDASMTNTQLKGIAMATAYNHFGFIYTVLPSEESLENLSFMCDTIIGSRDTSGMYESLLDFRYICHNAFDYTLNEDAEGHSYFEDYKNNIENNQSKEVAEGDGDDNTKEEEKQNSIMSPSIKSVVDNRRKDDEDDEEDDDGYAGLAFMGTSAKKSNKPDGELELDKMVGLTAIKEQIKDFAAFVQLSKIKSNHNLGNVPISKHMVFMGNPGTAKTSVALQLARILHKQDLIKNAEIKHVTRDDLVGKYVGWTAKLTKEAIQSAKGGILFVDEAYSLVAEGGANSYGQEAINTFVNYMDKADVRDSTIIIFAGYKEEMRQFIDSNPGLKSRVGFYFDFPDYTTDELVEIAKIQAEHAGYIITDDYIEKLRDNVDKNKGAKDFGNGRYVRNIFEKSVLKQSRRIMKDPTKAQSYSTKEELCTITGDDFSTKGVDVRDKRGVGFHSKAEELIEREK